jgi:hypothetical protein
VLGCPPDDLVRSTIESATSSFKIYLTNVAHEISSPGGQVVVVGYPAIFEDPPNWNGTAKVLDLCHGVNSNSARRIRGWAGLLNARLGGAVAAANAEHPNGVSFTFVNVQDGAGNIGPHGIDALKYLFEAPGSPDRHNLCGSDSWMFGLGPDAGFYHPNRSGHLAMASTIAPIIAALDWSRLGQSGPTPQPPPATPETPGPTSPPTASPPPTAPPVTQAPPNPATKTLTVSNLVTNGATEMREDSAAYLSTVTKNHCRRDGCMVPGTDNLHTGATVVAECWTTGDRTTNGQDNSTIDDGNPGLYTTTLWYHILWPDGRAGYLSEAWIAPGDRGGAGLRHC